MSSIEYFYGEYGDVESAFYAEVDRSLQPRGPDMLYDVVAALPLGKAPKCSTWAAARASSLSNWPPACRPVATATRALRRPVRPGGVPHHAGRLLLAHLPDARLVQLSHVRLEMSG